MLSSDLQGILESEDFQQAIITEYEKGGYEGVYKKYGIVRPLMQVLQRLWGLKETKVRTMDLALSQIIKSLGEGKTHSQIAKEIGVSRQSVSAFLKKMDIHKPDIINLKTKALSVLAETNISLEIYQEGISYLEGHREEINTKVSQGCFEDEIVEEYGVLKEIVLCYLVDIYGALGYRRRKIIYEGYQEGKSVTEIAKLLGLSRQTLYRYCKRNNINYIYKQKYKGIRLEAKDLEELYTEYREYLNKGLNEIRQTCENIDILLQVKPKVKDLLRIYEGVDKKFLYLYIRKNYNYLPKDYSLEWLETMKEMRVKGLKLEQIGELLCIHSTTLSNLFTKLK